MRDVILRRPSLLSCAMLVPRMLRSSHVVYGKDEIKGDKRPYFVLSEENSAFGVPQATLCLIRSVKESRAAPGTVILNEDDTSECGLDKPSAVTTTLVLRPSKELRPPEGHNGDATHVAGHVRRNVATMLGLNDSTLGYPARGFIKHLPPPARRADGLQLYEKLYQLLRSRGWSAPQQGDLLRAPPDHRLFRGKSWLVVSTTDYNRRCLYPEFVVVPLMSTVGQVHNAEAYRDAGRNLFGKNDGLSEDYVAIFEQAHSLSMSWKWFDKCDRCYSQRAPWHLKLTSGRDAGKCVHCDNAPAIWPKWIANVRSSRTFLEVLIALRKWLGVHT